MRESKPGGSRAEGDAAEQTSADWDAIQRGDRFDSGETETIACLEQLAAAVSSRSEFQQRLREQLMHMPTTAALAAGPTTPFTGVPRIRPLPSRNGPTRNAAGIAASLAVACVIMIGMFFLLQPGHDGSNHGLPYAGSTLPSTPANDYCVSRQDAIPVGQPFALIALGTSDELRGAALAATRVQLQKYALSTSSGQLTGPAYDPTTGGLVVDVVLQGIYSATFDVNVYVSGNKYVYPASKLIPARTPVELSHGDAVVFPYGGHATITNASATANLDFYRVLFVTKPTAGALPAGATEIASTMLPGSIGELFGQHSGQFELFLTQFAGSTADTTARRLCDGSAAVRIMTIQDPSALNAKADDVILALDDNRG